MLTVIVVLFCGAVVGETGGGQENHGGGERGPDGGREEPSLAQG